MTQLRELSNEVLVADESVVRVSAHDVADVVARGVRSSRKRARLCAHSDAADPLHEMLICLVRETYVRPHRHASKSESFHVIEGELDVVLFDDDGAVREVVAMGPYSSGKVFFYRLAEARFHMVLVNAPHALIHETTNGPFDPADTEFAAWAPAEGSSAAAVFAERLRRTIA